MTKAHVKGHMKEAEGKIKEVAGKVVDKVLFAAVIATALVVLPTMGLAAATRIRTVASVATCSTRARMSIIA